MRRHTRPDIVLRVSTPDPMSVESLSSSSRSRGCAGLSGLVFLIVMSVACVATLPWTLGRAAPSPEDVAQGRTTGEARYNAGQSQDGRFPPWWWGVGADDARRLNERVPNTLVDSLAAANGLTGEQIRHQTQGPIAARLRAAWPIHQHRIVYLLGTDTLGRSLLIRCLTGGGISLAIGVAAAALSVLIGTLYGALAGYAGGVIDAVMMRIVDVLYGLPYILLVVLLAVAVDSWIGNTVAHRVEAAAKARESYIDAGLARVKESGPCRCAGRAGR